MGDGWQTAMWEAIGRGLTAHAVMLRDADIVDDAVAAALLTAIDSAGRGQPPALSGARWGV
ncbi:MAG: hypothetical protein ACRDJC_01625 [Thermomicrobiales bacterium]